MIRLIKEAQGNDLPSSSNGDFRYGLFVALRCIIVLPDGAQRAAILKREPVGEIAAEAFATIIVERKGTVGILANGKQG